MTVTRVVSLAVVALAGCLQSPAKTLDPGTIEVLPPDNLQKGTAETLDPAKFVAPAEQPRPPPLSVTSAVSLTPPEAVRIGQLRQLTVTFEVIGAGEASVAALEFVAPGGIPYDRQETPLTGSAFDSHHLEFVLPVAATAIDTAKMGGTWTAALSIDGRQARDQIFELTP
jgi:hypothetical protein